jgi:hypothetical protein
MASLVSSLMDLTRRRWLMGAAGAGGDQWCTMHWLFWVRS